MRNQWVHVAVFFAAPALVFWTAHGFLGFGWSIGALGFCVTVGAAAAIGRFAVCKNAALVPAGARLIDHSCMKASLYLPPVSGAPISQNHGRLR